MKYFVFLSAIFLSACVTIKTNNNELVLPNLHGSCKKLSYFTHSTDSTKYSFKSNKFITDYKPSSNTAYFVSLKTDLANNIYSAPTSFVFTNFDNTETSQQVTSVKNNAYTLDNTDVYCFLDVVEVENHSFKEVKEKYASFCDLLPNTKIYDKNITTNSKASVLFFKRSGHLQCAINEEFYSFLIWTSHLIDKQ